MAYVKGKDALLSEPDEDDVDIAMVPSDPENANGQKSNVFCGVRGKRNEAKSKKKVTKVGRRKKKTPSREKAKGALISISKVQEDGVNDNVDTEIVPSDPVVNGKESIISVSVHDENNLTDDVGTGTATSDKHHKIDNIDTGIAKSGQMKMNDEESFVVSEMQSEVDHLKEQEVGDASTKENVKEVMANEVDSRNEAKNEEKLKVTSKNKVSKPRKAGKKKIALKMNSKESNAVPGIQDKVEHLKELEVEDGNFEKNIDKEVMNEADSTNEANNEEKPEGNSKNKVTELRKTGKKKMSLRGTNKVVAKKRVNSESSNKTRTKDNATGMIFMCSSKTKEDCFRYKVFGLPANKRDMVFKIYEGMRLFLFDYDLKMMHGIYKAAGPGGFNIEPRAFQSAFPSQVRFTVVEDCLPLAEEKFKKIIIDNYYTTNKFNCQLTIKQVKNLSKLFKASSEGSKSKRLRENSRAEALTFVDHLSKRPRRSWKSANHRVVDRLCQSRRGEIQEYFYHGHRYRGEERHPASSRDHLYSVLPVEYRRELYPSPLAHRSLPHSMHQPLAPELPLLETDFYRRDQFRYHDEQFLDVELRPQDELDHHDSSKRFYHDKFQHRDSYRRFHHDEFERRDSYKISRHQNVFNHRGTYRRSQHQAEFKHHNTYRRFWHQDEFKGRDSYKTSREHQLDHRPSSSAAKPPKYSSPASRRPASKDHGTTRPPADKRPGPSP